MGIAQLALCLIALLSEALRTLVDAMKYRYETRTLACRQSVNTSTRHTSTAVAPYSYLATHHKTSLSRQVRTSVIRRTPAERSMSAIMGIPVSSKQPRPVRALRLFLHPDSEGRIAMAGTMAEVCAELDRMVARETILS